MIAASSMSMSNFGIFSILYVSALLLADLADFGTGAYELNNDNFTDSIDESSRFKRLASARLTFFLLLSPFLLLLFVVNPKIFSIATSIAVCAFFMSLRILLLTELRSIRDYSKVSLCQISDRVFLLVLFLIFSPVTPEAVLLLVTLSNLFTLFIFRWRPIFKSNIHELIKLYSKSRALGISSIASDLALLDVLLLAAVGSSSDVASYTLVSRLSAPVLLIGTSIAMVSVKELSMDLVKREKIRKEMKSVLVITIGSCVTVGFVMYLLSSLFIFNLMDNRYGNLNSLLILTLTGAVFWAIWQVVGAFFQSRLLFILNQKYTLYVAFFYLLSVIGFALNYGMYSVPLAQIGVYSVSTLFGVRFILTKIDRG